MEASRTITDPPEVLVRIALDATSGDPPPGYQAVHYFEDDTDALRWLAELEPPQRVLSIHRLGHPQGITAAIGGLRWQKASYEAPSVLGRFVIPLEHERVRTRD